MAVNRFDYFGITLFNLTTDTVTADTLVSGVTAHDKAGNLVTGTLKVQNVHVVTSEPSASSMVAGDLYFVTEG